ncbi:MAG: hypothetical protein ACKV19_05125 [Verrucomicrobiales bacterium]
MKPFSYVRYLRTAISNLTLIVHRLRAREAGGPPGLARLAALTICVLRTLTRWWWSLEVPPAVFAASLAIFLPPWQEGFRSLQVMVTLAFVLRIRQRLGLARPVAHQKGGRR